MLLIQVDNLIIPPATTPGDYLAQLESEGLGEEDAAVLKEMRAQVEGDDSSEPGVVPPQLLHLFKKHFRQGRFLIATMSEAAAARICQEGLPLAGRCVCWRMPHDRDTIRSSGRGVFRNSS